MRVTYASLFKLADVIRTCLGPRAMLKMMCVVVGNTTSTFDMSRLLTDALATAVDYSLDPMGGIL